MAEETDVYLNLREEMYLRIRQQNRCIDQSIYLFSGFVALLVALAGSDNFSTIVLKTFSNARACFVATFVMFIFTCIQFLILLNYLYQTWTLIAIDIFVGETATASQGLRIGVWENRSWAMRRKRGGKFTPILGKAQPLLIYAILLFGIGCQSVLLFVQVLNIEDKPWYFVFGMIAGLILCIVALVFLVLVHFKIVESPNWREDRAVENGENS